MEEARYSINIRFSVKGFDSQLTVRGDVKDDIGSDFAAAVEFLETHGALPERRWENGKNGQTLPKSTDKPGPGPAAVIAQPKPGPGPAAAIAQPKPVMVQPMVQPGDPLYVCTTCMAVGTTELITFTDKKTGLSKKAYKCQSCQKWLR